MIMSINGNMIAHRVARSNPAVRMLEHQRDLRHHQEARSDPKYRTSEQLSNDRRRQQVRHSRDASYRAISLTLSTTPHVQAWVQ